MRERLGWAALIFGLSGLAVMVYTFQSYRFAHPELTETQLMLWTMDRWRWWVLPLVATACGLYAVQTEKKGNA